MSDTAGSTRDTLVLLATRAMAAHGFQPVFSDAAMKQAAAALPIERLARDVRDLRSLPWCSIDNDDSRDLDQLTVAELLADTHVRILVAIADVDETAGIHTPVDVDASVNTTSVYTPALVFPMLPPRLSTDVTSLIEGQDRLAVVVGFTVDDEGGIVASEIVRALVRNYAKLAYRRVAAWFENGAADGAGIDQPRIADQLRLQDRVAQRMRARRRQHGALSLETIETRPVFDGERVTDLRREETNRAKELIEDFMIAANTVSAGFLAAHGVPAIRRVLRAPARWDRIVAMAAALGEALPPAPDAPALEAFLLKQRAANPEEFPTLSLAVVKLLGSSEYVVNAPGHPSDSHFALAVGEYTHATAPNRRYADLVTQRMLKAVLAEQSSPYDVPTLEAMARHCNQQQSNAAKVERQVRKSAAALLMRSRIGDTFETIVTGASSKGVWVRTLQPPIVEGRLERGGTGLDVGDHVRATLISTDVEKGFIDFESSTI